ncbi:MAG TPA: hypothetical protein PLG49_01650 [Defluviitaleaceae bacterium]|nr:hypothetical protein [Defluviitaleaceae bacterium]
MNSFKKCICLLISTLLLISSLSGCGILNNSKSTGSSQSGNTVSEDTDNKKQEKQVGALIILCPWVSLFPGKMNIPVIF